MEEKKQTRTQFKDKNEELTVPRNRAKMLRKESEHFRKKTGKRRIFDCFARLWRFEHISLVRTPIDGFKMFWKANRRDYNFIFLSSASKCQCHGHSRSLKKTHRKF